MTQTFSLTSQRCASVSDPSLRKEIDRYTMSPEATAKILSCIERFGSDGSIRSFEMTRKTSPYGRWGKTDLAWSVRGVRSLTRP